MAPAPAFLGLASGTNPGATTISASGDGGSQGLLSGLLGGLNLKTLADVFIQKELAKQQLDAFKAQSKLANQSAQLSAIQATAEGNRASAEAAAALRAESGKGARLTRLIIGGGAALAGVVVVAMVLRRRGKR
jgi:hypothetical protein